MPPYKIDTAGHYPIIYTSTNDVIQGFFYEHNKKTYCIPEPNPITIYFDIAQANLKHIHQARATLLVELSKSNANASAILNYSHTYYSVTSVYIIFLFTALEAFINYHIPDDYSYNKEDNRGVKLTYDKEAIQRNLSFDEKLKDVIPAITGKYFHKEAAHKYDHIYKLLKLRDNIMHTKVEITSSPNIYKGLFCSLLDFPYEKVILSARDFINYYSPNLIEECQCGRAE